jgi:hypothetical protein
MRLKRLPIPILLLLLFNSAYAASHQIKRIQIKSTYVGWAHAGEEELIIEKKDGHYYARDKIVSDDTVCALLEVIDSRIIEKPDLDNLGLTQTWLNENARQALIDHLKKQTERSSPEQKKRFLASFTNLQVMKEIVNTYYEAHWTDDLPRVEIVVRTDEDKVIEISSGAQQEFMLPWHVSSVGPGEYFTWDASFSRVIAQLLPQGFLNRERIAGLGLRQALSGLVVNR